MKIRSLSLALIVLSLAQAQYTTTPEIVTKVATAAANWLKMETDIRSVAMGGANVASGRSVSTIPRNPAAIAYLEKSAVYYAYSSYLAGISYQSVALGSKVGHSDYLGIHLFYLDSGPIERTTIENSQGDGTFYHVYSMALRTTYARRMTDRLKVGLTLNYIDDRIDNTQMQSFAFDLGSNFITGIYGFTLGMSVSNFGPEVSYYGDGLTTLVNDELDPTNEQDKVTESFPIPLLFRLGVANNIIGRDSEFYPSSIHRLTFTIEGVNPLDYVMTGNLGIEYAWQERAMVRAGTHIEHDTAGFSTGLGYRYRADRMIVSIDYAYVNYGILEQTNQFGITLDF